MQIWTGPEERNVLNMEESLSNTDTNLADINGDSESMNRTARTEQWVNDYLSVPLAQPSTTSSITSTNILRDLPSFCEGAFLTPSLVLESTTNDVILTPTLIRASTRSRTSAFQLYVTHSRTEISVAEAENWPSPPSSVKSTPYSIRGSSNREDNYSFDPLPPPPTITDSLLHPSVSLTMSREEPLNESQTSL